MLAMRSLWARKKPSRMTKTGLLCGFVVLAGCQMGASSKVSVDYYSISGDSTADLDREIKQKGPRIGGGKHAVAVARIRMIPNIRYEKTAKGCRASSAKIAVNARVTLPRWTGRNTASKAVGKAWDNIDRYTRLHEAVHVAIAFRHAKDTERELLAAQPQANCKDMRQVARAIVSRNLQLHDKAQRQFDAQEQRRFAAIARKQLKLRSQITKPTSSSGS